MKRAKIQSSILNRLRIKSAKIRLAKKYISILKKYIRIYKIIKSRKQYYQSDTRPNINGNSNGNVLIISSTLGNLRISQIDILIKRMLDENSIKSEIHFCGGLLPICSLCEEEKIDQNVLDSKNYSCTSCNLFDSKAIEVEKNFGLIEDSVAFNDYKRYNNDINQFVDNFKSFKKKELYKNINIHEHASSTLARYYGRSIDKIDVLKNQEYNSIYLKCLISACTVAEYWHNRFGVGDIESIILNHGLYIPQGVILEVARFYGIRVSTWHLGYRKGTILIATGDTYHKTLLDPIKNDRTAEALSEDKKSEILRYLKSRRTGNQDQISFVYYSDEEDKALLKKINESTNNAFNFIVALNVSWDAQSHYKDNIYDSMEEWIAELIEIAKSFEGKANFIFRCHPAEVTGRRISRFPTSRFILDRISSSNNIYVINADDKISTYDLIDYCDAGIIYASKVGVEIACSGKELIICGESCLRNKDIGREVKHKSDLHFHIEDIVSGSRLIDKEKALKYAYHLFFKEMMSWNRLSNKNDSSSDYQVITKLLGENAIPQTTNV